MTSLIDVVRKRFLDSIRSVNPGRWKVLVVDEHSQKLLSATLKQYDVLAENVTTIDQITAHRQPEPSMQAMYLLMPTTQNVDRIIRDFSGQQMYAGAHLFFTDRLSEKLFNKLTSSPAEPHLQGLVDLYINFWAIEAQAWSIYAPSLFFSMFSPPRTPAIQRSARDRLEEDLRFIAQSILNTCVQLNEYPSVRYYLPSHHPAVGPLSGPDRNSLQLQQPEGSGRWRAALGVGNKVDYSGEDHLPRVLAYMVQQELDEYKKSNPNWPEQQPGGVGGARPQALMLIADRTMDIAAAMVHEFTYQAMANDLLEITDGVKFRYKFQSSSGVYEDKVATISDADQVWVQTRHMHMRETIDKLMADFNGFMEKNAGFSGGGAASLNDMKDMLADLPQYQEQREQFSLHLNMAQQCMDLMEKKKLLLTANVEQNCATGLAADGRVPKTLVEEMVPLLADSAVSNAEKMRIIALYVWYRDGVPEEDLRRLFEHARLTKDERAAIHNLGRLGLRVTRGTNDRDTRKRIKNRPADDDYDLSRYKPVLKTVIEDLVTGRLDTSVFPYVKESTAPATSGAPKPGGAPAPGPVSLRSKPQWTKSGRPAGSNETRQRVLVFVAGGMTYSEMRTAYELSRQLGKDVFVGSTHTITPEMVLDDLKVLERGGQGSQSIPNGLPESTNSQQRPFQGYYDAKYWTKDQPPPARPAPAPMPSGGGSEGRLGIKQSNTAWAPSSSPMPTPGPGTGPSVREREREKEKKKKGFLGF